MSKCSGDSFMSSFIFYYFNKLGLITCLSDELIIPNYLCAGQAFPRGPSICECEAQKGSINNVSSFNNGFV